MYLKKLGKNLQLMLICGLELGII